MKAGDRVVKTSLHEGIAWGFAPVGERGTIVEVQQWPDGKTMYDMKWDTYQPKTGGERCFADEIALECAEIVGDGPRQYGDGYDHPTLGPRSETLYPDSEPHLPPMEAFHGPGLCDDPDCRLCYPQFMQMSDSEMRKMMPVGTVATEYFPLARRGEAAVAWVGNEKHNPDERLHWSRGKSDDHLDCMFRHAQDAVSGDGWDTTTLPDGRVYQVRHASQVAWRASAFAQLDAESVGGQVVRRLK